ncbi:MAG TPA: hypothetical protein VM818_14965 [Vicinamibacterales bacterium]|jgi:hypothetical protein|nr:hypothetical protein [Vicinamibacterales bacterium]
MPHECFADEIAIDFPSLEPAVERMRDSFLGERADAEPDDVVRLELHVTRRDMWEGASVPIEVPIRGVCRRCGGRGEVWTEPCEACASTGVTLERRLVRIPLPRGLADGGRFRVRVSVPGGESVRFEIRITSSNRVIE